MYDSLQMHVDSVHKAKPKNPGQKATAASFKALNSSPEYPEALKKIQSSKSRSSAHTREWELQKKERAGLQGTTLQSVPFCGAPLSCRASPAAP